MYTTITNLFYKLLVLLLSISVGCAGGSVAPSTDTPIAPENADECKMTAVLWADMQISDYLLSRNEPMKAACLDIANATEKIDALAMVGDIAENGKGSEYRVVLDNLNLFKGKVDNILPATGNHDIRLRIFSNTVKTFSEFSSSVNESLNLDKLYYSYEVNGYKFIVLGSTRTEFEEAYINEAELNWLDSELKSATENGLPVFVLLHQPLKFTHNLPDAWGSPIKSAGSVGAQSDDLKRIMSGYKNVFLITGHLHSGFASYTYEEIDGIHGVNLPSLTVAGDGYGHTGTGLVMEVYGDTVKFRARDFSKGEYLPQFDMEYTIVK